MSPSDALRFEPPEYGLLPKESVVWSRPAGISFTTIFCGVCSPLLVVIPGIFMFVLFGDVIGYTFLLLLLLVFIMSLRSFITERRTMYYITTKRVIHVLGGNIVQAIFLDHLEGRPRSEFLELKETAQVNHRPVYSIRISDPRAPIEIKLKNVEDDKAEMFEKLGEIVTCSKCGYVNIAVLPRCKKCDARLR